MSFPIVLRQRIRHALPHRGNRHPEPTGSLDLIGMEMAPQRRSRQNPLIVPLIAGGLLAALFVVGMRNNLTRMRYEIASAIGVEQALRDEKLAITVEMRRLRDPKRLSLRAAELGFVYPECVVDLAEGVRVQSNPISACARDGARPQP